MCVFAGNFLELEVTGDQDCSTYLCSTRHAYNLMTDKAYQCGCYFICFTPVLLMMCWKFLGLCEKESMQILFLCLIKVGVKFCIHLPLQTHKTSVCKCPLYSPWKSDWQYQEIDRYNRNRSTFCKIICQFTDLQIYQKLSIDVRDIA